MGWLKKKKGGWGGGEEEKQSKTWEEEDTRTNVSIIKTISSYAKLIIIIILPTLYNIYPSIHTCLYI